MPEQAYRTKVSVISPAHNEQENIRPLVEQIVAALDPSGLPYEIILINDGSTDGTAEIIRSLLEDYPQLQGICMTDTPRGEGMGQSAAFHAGFRAAEGELIAVLDADLQNDPADIPSMLQCLRETGADMIQGDRSHARRDHLVRRISSMVGRLFRGWLLGDTIRDTCCSLRIVLREVALAIPLQFKGMHRFIPITARQLGYKVVEMPVAHRPRVAGQPKYGVWNRAIPSLFDCLAVRWMRKRRRPARAMTIVPAATSDKSAPEPDPTEAVK